MVSHLLFGKLLAPPLGCMVKGFDLGSFMTGNLLPDLAVNKNSVHHYKEDEVSHLYVPDFDAAKVRYSRLGNLSLRLGVLAHLFLDLKFTRGILCRDFFYSEEKGFVFQLNYPYLSCTLDEFFSPSALYGTYGMHNHTILGSGRLSMEWITSNVPRELPPTGMSTLDDRQPEKWFEQLGEYLSHNPTDRRPLFSYSELMDCIDEAVCDFLMISGDIVPTAINPVVPAKISGCRWETEADSARLIVTFPFKN